MRHDKPAAADRECRRHDDRAGAHDVDGRAAPEADGLADASEDAGERRERQGAAQARARRLERRERVAARLALGEVRLDLGRALVAWPSR